MKSGTSGSTRRGRFIPFVVAALLIGVAIAQQSTNPPQEQTFPPAELPAAQPASQAATSVSGETTPKADEPIKPVDQSAMTKLGAGDLLEVNVYNVPELTSKVRVGNS